MKDDIFSYVIIGLIVVTVVFGFNYGLRWFSDKASPIRVEEVAPGVTCAKIVTADGVAIDCWKDN